jgi:hypothetical protein
MRKFKYGLTPEAYEALLAKAGHACEICRRKPDGTHGRRLVIDHCHASGVVRGILCDRCNSGLGSFRDDTNALEQAAAYLRERQP